MNDAWRRRRTFQVVNSLQELIPIPTSSTLGESSEGTPRSETEAAGNGTALSGSNEDLSDEREETSPWDALLENNNTLINLLSARPGLSALLQRGSERIRWGEYPTNDSTGTPNNQNSQSHDYSHIADQNQTINHSNSEGDGENFEIVDEDMDGGNDDNIQGLSESLDHAFREQILNTMMDRSISMLRRSGNSGDNIIANTTDVKCPVCSEVFIDYEPSNHPNAAGNRPGSTCCSHGALLLFTKLHQCPICFEEDIEPPNVVSLSCGHVVCREDFFKLGGYIVTDDPEGRPHAKPVPYHMEGSAAPAHPVCPMQY